MDGREEEFRAQLLGGLGVSVYSVGGWKVEGVGCSGVQSLLSRILGLPVLI